MVMIFCEQIHKKTSNEFFLLNGASSGIVSDYCFTLRSRSLYFAYAKLSFTLLRATSGLRLRFALRKILRTQGKYICRICSSLFTRWRNDWASKSLFLDWIVTNCKYFSKIRQFWKFSELIWGNISVVSWQMPRKV